MLRPSRRGQIAMYISRLQSKPIHGRKMADRVASMAVFDELWLRGSPRREIQLEWIAPSCFFVRFEYVRFRIAGLEIVPTGSGFAHCDSREGSARAVKICAVFRTRDDVARATARYPVNQISRREQNARWNDHGAQLDRGEHHFPQRSHVAEH